MTIIKLLLLCVSVMLPTTAQSQAKGWRGIVPLHSTRADVERLIGKPNFKYDLYDFEKERVSILYSSDPCTEGLQGGWNVPRDTVIQISVAPKEKVRLPDLQIDLSKYEKAKDPLMQVHTYYTNKEEGTRYVVFEGGGEDGGKILNTYYEPAAEDRHLRCPDSTPQVTKADCSRTKQALPLGDPCPTIEIVGPSGDLCRRQRVSLTANLGGIAPRFKPTFKWSVSAGTILSGQSTSSIEVDTIDVGGKSLTVTLKVGGVIPEGCPKVETYTTECSKH
ncbi:MAG: hypothetical protein M3416_01580 [Acidobacteriota bacterium]|nr:hypothetical protein [Acidobacteriota bacterium]